VRNIQLEPSLHAPAPIAEVEEKDRGEEQKKEKILAPPKIC
jgi:hypothetical protein